MKKWGPPPSILLFSKLTFNQNKLKKKTMTWQTTQYSLDSR
ncbi:hypothetical protein SAMN05216197_1801 [Pseudomonas graminis]|uniref:Uncharacterized protein n=1 Tax=Pseudomonas graminis TaxID=158627 RepID=A0A1I0JS62_9PSED|nr:hypothetical protein SAMN05216197_1801 [Pseudomonas graminis]